MRILWIILLTTGCLWGAAADGQAAVLRLSNGDQLTGRIVSESSAAVVLDHEFLGTITLPKSGVAEMAHEAPASPTTTPAARPPAEWTREATVAYHLTRGNALDESLAGSFTLNRKARGNEWTLKASGDYASANRRMNAQRYDGMARWARSVGPRLAWYNFYTAEIAHDRFANVDWRATPSTGVGYWFADREAFKAMAEVGIGWERTVFRDATARRREFILAPRVLFFKRLFGDVAVSQEVAVWPRLDDLSAYRLRSETRLTNPLGAGLSMRLSVIDEFQSEPAQEAGRNDLRILSSLVYSF